MGTREKGREESNIIIEGWREGGREGERERERERLVHFLPSVKADQQSKSQAPPGEAMDVTTPGDIAKTLVS